MDTCNLMVITVYVQLNKGACRYDRCHYCTLYFAYKLSLVYSQQGSGFIPTLYAEVHPSLESAQHGLLFQMLWLMCGDRERGEPVGDSFPSHAAAACCANAQTFPAVG